MNLPKNTLFIIIFTFTFLNNSTFTKRQLVTKLSQLCPTVELLHQKKDKDEKIKELVVNIQNFEDSIVQPEVQPLGDGGFGKVFNYEYFFTAPGSGGTRANAIKVITLNEDAATPNGLKYQNLFRNEVIASTVANQLDPDFLYMPRYDGCVEVTQEFKNMEAEESVENKQYITTPPKTATFLYLTQRLDSDLYKFTKKYLRGEGPMFDQINRIQMGLNLFKGMRLFNEKYVHCDMKPENIMLKTISEEKASELLEKDYKAIETGPGHNYQPYIIDFGLVVSGQQRCIGGTPGFFPPEMFNQESQAHFDVYGIAMMMLDLELAAQKIPNLSDVLAPSHEMQYYQKTGEFSNKNKQKLQENELFKMIKNILDNDGQRQNIDKFKNIYNPSFEQIVSRYNKNLKWGVNKPSEFIFVNTSIFDTLIMSVMNLFHYTSIFTADISENIKNITFMLEGYQKNVADGNQVEINQSNIDFAQASIRVQTAIKSLRRTYYEILFDMIQPLKKRKLFDEAIQEIENALNEFKMNNKEDLKLLDEMKVKSAKALQMELFSKRMRNSGQNINEESSRRRQENIDQIMESRRQRMGSLYERRRLML